MKKETIRVSTVYTIGHSTRTLEEFVKILKAYEIDEVVDIRTIPRSRHNPQYNKEVLPDSLKLEKIKYKHIAALGGLRHALPDSLNIGWRNASFRGFADYMQTKDFENGLDQIVRLSQRLTPVLMCAEAVPWRCHRSLIGDALLVRGIRSIDIFSEKNSRLHVLTPWARVRGKKITYPKSLEAEEESDS